MQESNSRSLEALCWASDGSVGTASRAACCRCSSCSTSARKRLVSASIDLKSLCLLSDSRSFCAARSAEFWSVALRAAISSLTEWQACRRPPNSRERSWFSCTSRCSALPLACMSAPTSALLPGASSCGSPRAAVPLPAMWRALVDVSVGGAPRAAVRAGGRGTKPMSADVSGPTRTVSSSRAACGAPRGLRSGTGGGPELTAAPAWST